MIIPLHTIRPTLSNWPTQPKPGDLLWDPNEQAIVGAWTGRAFHGLAHITDRRTRYLWCYQPARVLIAQLRASIGAAVLAKLAQRLSAAP